MRSEIKGRRHSWLRILHSGLSEVCSDKAHEDDEQVTRLSLDLFDLRKFIYVKSSRFGEMLALRGLGSAAERIRV